jgi:protein-tyrosine-phosphatase
MAEAILRARVGDAVDLVSAGMEAGPLHQLTLPVLEEAGFALHAHSPVHAKTLLGRSSFNTVILISGPRDRLRPRMFFGAIDSLVWEVEDPTAAPEAERLEAFRRCRDHLAELVDEWIASHLELEHAAHDDERTPTRVMRIPKPNLI